MKRANKFTIVLLVFVFSFSSIAFPVIADEGITVILNGKELVFDVSQQIIDGRTMVPIVVMSSGTGAGNHHTTKTGS